MARIAHQIQTPPELPPGMLSRRFAPSFHYELLICGLRGHVLAGVGDPDVIDTVLVRQFDGLRWHRCLRCDSWLPLPTDSSHVPSGVRRRHRRGRRDEIPLPLRGKPLRDKIILRIIAIDRVLHFLVLWAISFGLLLVVLHHDQLKQTFDSLARDLHLTGSTAGTYVGIGVSIGHVLAYDQSHILLLAIAFGTLATIELIEAVGLWIQARWAEYLTVAVTSLGLPYELWELAHGVSMLKLIALAVNLMIVAYLLLAKRLFGLRGGEAAIRAAYERDLGWEALERTTPGAWQPSTADGEPVADTTASSKGAPPVP